MVVLAVLAWTLIITRVGAGVVWRGVGTLASPLVPVGTEKAGEVQEWIRPGAIQGSLPTPYYS